MRFWRLMFGLSLVAILSATPARQVEAAEDFARSMAEVGQGNRVEETDGGVGDDSIEALKADANEVGGSVAITPDWSGLGASCFLLPSHRSVAEPGRNQLRDLIVPGISARSSRRQAWLQRFLF